MRRFGSRVTIIERNGRLVDREDQDVSETLHDLFRDEGIEVVASAHVTHVEGKSGESVKLHAEHAGSEAKDRGVACRLAKIPMVTVLRTRRLKHRSLALTQMSI
jgi:pyruvate/2-oxoglutarate dehydrogenase complex dihydrolipoamide dehydrogenase (E3) component